MRQIQINYLNMVAGVIAGMHKEQPLWENEPEIVSLFNSVESEYNLVVTKGENVSGTDTTGYTNAKANTFDRLMAATYKLACKLSAYAKMRNDMKLLPLVDLSLTGLSRGPEKDAVSRCASIVEHAQTRLAQLGSFKITDAELTAIRQLISDYNQQSGDRSTVVSDKSVTGKEIADHISIIRLKLDTLDDLVEGLIDDEGFIARYKSLRMIIDYGKGKTLKNKEPETAAV